MLLNRLESLWLEIESLRENVTVLITAHNYNVVAVVGHHDCVANPVGECKHLRHIQ